MLKAVLAGAELVKIRKALLGCVGHLREARAGKTRSIGLAAKMRPEAREIRCLSGGQKRVRNLTFPLGLLCSGERFFFKFIDANFVLCLLQRGPGRIAHIFADTRA